MANTVVDTLTINVKTDTTQAQQGVEKLNNTLDRFKNKASATSKKTNRVFEGIGKGALTACKGVKSIASVGLNMVSSAIGKITGKFTNLLRMIKKRVMYRAINAAISAVVNGVKEGTNNLYQWSKALGGTFSKSMDRASTSMLYFKNSIGAMVAPIINVLVPVLERAIIKIVEFVNTLNQLFAKLSGASTWTRALMYPKEYAEAANNANKAAKKWKATILGIDELNLMADNSDHGSGSGNDGLDYSSMFEEVALDAANSPFLNFFAPLMEAWNTTGAQVIEKVTGAFNKLKSLGQSVGNTFLQLWFGGRGQASAERFLDIISRIFGIIGNIAASLEKAWNKNDNGLNLMNSLWDVFDSILGAIDNIVIATEEWAENVDFEPLLQSLVGLFEELSPLIDKIGEGLSEIIPVVLTEFVEGDLPRLIDQMTSLSMILNGIIDMDFGEVWEGLKLALSSTLPAYIWNTTHEGVLAWWQENVFTPLGDHFSELWSKVSSWAVEAWDKISTKASDAWEKIKGFFSPAVEWFKSIFNSVKQTFSDIWDDIEIIVTGCWEIIKRAWEIASSWFNEHVVTPIKDFFEPLWNSVKEKAQAAWDGIKEVFGKVGSFFEETFRNAWEKVVSVFSPLGEIFNDIKDGVISGFKVVVNGLIKGINKVVKIPFEGINKALETLKGISILGISPFTNLKTISIPEIPLLAEGGIVDAGTAFIAGEAGAEVIASMGRKTGVMNVSQMAAGVEEGVARANAPQTALLREQNEILREIARRDKRSGVGTRDILADIDRMNRRSGGTLVPVGI